MIKKEKNSKKNEKYRKHYLVSDLISIIGKNLKLIARSRSSSIIVLLGPLLIIALVGTAYNTSNIYDIRIGAYSSEYSDLSNSILESIGKQFAIVKMNSKEECISSLKSSQVHVCAIIPSKLEVGTKEPIDFNVDQSRVNLVWIVIDAISTDISSKKSELSLQMTTSILNVLSDARTKIEAKKSTIINAGESNKEALGRLEIISSNLEELSLDVEKKIDISKISQKLDEIILANNLSSAAFDPVKKTIKNVMNNTESFEKDLIAKTSDSISSLKDVKTRVAGSVTDLEDVKNSLENMKENIDTALGTKAETVVSPIQTNVIPIVTEKTHLSFLFPTLLVLVIMLIGLLLSSGLVVREKTSPAYFRNFITPAKDSIFILGHFLTNFIILVMQLVIILIIASIFFRDDLVRVLYPTFVSLIIINSVFVLIGMLLGYLFKSEETSILATVCVASLFLFFSSTILPLETLPTYLKNIADFNPFVLSESILKKVMLFKYGLSDLSQSLVLLIAYVGLLLVLVYGAQKISKSQIQ